MDGSVVDVVLVLDLEPGSDQGQGIKEAADSEGAGHGQGQELGLVQHVPLNGPDGSRRGFRW